jgi:hypothetical protein
MKKIIFITVAIALAMNVSGQRFCGSELNLTQLQQTDPVRYQNIMNLENQLQTGLQSYSLSSIPQSTIIIPVVVHVVYNNSAQNISDAQINAQIQVLNQDYRRLNADKTNTPAAFASVAGDANIEFRLAKIDPNGNSTSGITRTSTSVSGFSEYLHNVKHTSSGGRDAWNTQRYLNIWVCKLYTQGLLGYATYPDQLTTNPDLDGVVISYTAFGVGGHTVSPNNKGRTTTHEVGHWLNLRHPWADEENCTATDFVSDTPNQYTRTYYCPSFPKTDACTSTSPGIMFMNYMDYTDDACMNLFTNGQIARMRAMFDTQTGIRKEIMTLATFLTNPPYITGPAYFNTSGTFTLHNLPSGATFTCSGGNLQSSVSGNSITLSGTNETEPHIGNISALVTFNNTSYWTKPIQFIYGEYVPEFVAGISYSGGQYVSGWCISGSGSGLLMIDNAGSIERQLLTNMQYQARILNSNGTVHYTLPNTFSFPEVGFFATGCSGGYPYYMLELRNVTYNVNSTWVRLFDYIYGIECGSMSYSSMFTVSPNPVSDVLSISLDQTAVASLQQQQSLLSSSVSNLLSATFDIRLYDSNGTLQRQSSVLGQNTAQLNVSNLPGGIYFLHIYNGQTLSKPQVHRIVINH